MISDDGLDRLVKKIKDSLEKNAISYNDNNIYDMINIKNEIIKKPEEPKEPNITNNKQNTSNVRINEILTVL